MTYSWSRRLVASALSAFVIALIVHVANITALTLGYIASSGASWASFNQLSDFFALASVLTFLLLIVAGLIGAYRRWWTALIAGLVVGLLATLLNSLLVVSTAGGGASVGDITQYLLNSIAGLNMFFIALLIVLSPTFGRYLYRVFAEYDRTGGTGRRIALVRIPSVNLAGAQPESGQGDQIDSAKVDEQWDAYVSALTDAGWNAFEVASNDDLADSVFVEDAAVSIGRTAIMTNPGALSRRAEIADAELAMRENGQHIEHIVEPGTLDGGDVLRIGMTLFVGRSEHTNADGIRQLRGIANKHGYTVVTIPKVRTLNLKHAVTALPDGTVIGNPDAADIASVFPHFITVPEPNGAQVVVIDHETVLMSSAAPKSAELIADLGYRVIVVDISEFEKLGGSVTRLSALIN